MSVSNLDLESGETNRKLKKRSEQDEQEKKEVKGQTDRQRKEASRLEKARKTTKWTEKTNGEKTQILRLDHFLLSSLSLCAKTSEVPIRWTVV